MCDKKDGMKGIVAVAIDKDKESENALKFAIDRLVTKGSTIILIHVNVKTSSSISTPSEQCLVVRKESDEQTKRIFKPYRTFCARKDIHNKDIVLEHEDVSKALNEYISQSAVKHLVIGCSNRNGYIDYKAETTPGRVLKGAPSFCTIYVISKGKIQYMRLGSSVKPNPAKPCVSIATEEPERRSFDEKGEEKTNDQEEPSHRPSSDATSSIASEDDVMTLLLKMREDQRDYWRFANEAHEWHRRVYNLHFKGDIIDRSPIFPAHILGDMEEVQPARHETSSKVAPSSKKKSKKKKNDKKVNVVETGKTEASQNRGNKRDMLKKKSQEKHMLTLKTQIQLNMNK
ncbi:U-box domain-containing protein 35-like [Vicia villosa]|uniref:U-box domain-containing protein 35-like n=1 Tax=Vicia villosa TaxID=3911 RepID=UPI00273BEDB5|nr:U-box domain-containing protein 35-like [Vicia villosa]